MNKNRKKIIGTLLGIMASVSSAGAMQNATNTGSANTGITNNKDEKQNKFKKRGEVKADPYLRALDVLTKVELFNEFLSTTPLRKFSRPFLRQLVTNYRRVHGFSGYVMRHDNPKYANDVFKLNGDDGHDFRVRVDAADDFFKGNNDEPCKTVAAESSSNKIIGELNNGKFQLGEYLSEASLNLVAEAKVKSKEKYHRLFEAKTIWDIDDAANAIDKANKLLDIINDPKASADQKMNMIEKRFGKDVVFIPKEGKLNDEIVFRIFLGKKKFPVIDVEKVINEKFLAGELGEGPEEENKQSLIKEGIESLAKTLGTFDQSIGLKCYAEFKLVKNEQWGAKK